jgi:hypothetical protein
MFKAFSFVLDSQCSGQFKAAGVLAFGFIHVLSAADVT